MATRRDLLQFAASLAGLAAFVMLLLAAGVTDPTTPALGFLVLVLVTATRARLRVAVLTAVSAMLALNFFFLPPIGTFTIADPQNWVALLAFLAAAVIVSQLSAAALARAREAVERRNELARLYDLSRDVLLTTESSNTLDALARHIARRFELERVAICLPGPAGWHVHQGGERDVSVDHEQLNVALARAGATLEFDARQRTYGGHLQVRGAAGEETSLVPVRFGTRPIGLLAAPASTFDPGTLDAVAGFAAIAVGRLVRRRPNRHVPPDDHHEHHPVPRAGIPRLEPHPADPSPHPEMPMSTTSTPLTRGPAGVPDRAGPSRLRTGFGAPVGAAASCSVSCWSSHASPARCCGRSRPANDAWRSRWHETSQSAKRLPQRTSARSASPSTARSTRSPHPRPTRCSVNRSRPASPPVHCCPAPRSGYRPCPPRETRGRRAGPPRRDRGFHRT